MPIKRYHASALKCHYLFLAAQNMVAVDGNHCLFEPYSDAPETQVDVC